MKHKIKDEIRKSSIPSDIKSKCIFDDISQEIDIYALNINQLNLK